MNISLKFFTQQWHHLKKITILIKIYESKNTTENTPTKKLFNPILLPTVNFYQDNSKTTNNILIIQVFKSNTSFIQFFKNFKYFIIKLIRNICV